MSRTQEKIIQTTSKIYTGIDVGKNQLDVFIHPSNIRLQVPNNKKAIEGLTKKLLQKGVHIVALEATGKYHCLAHSMMHEAGIAVAVINPFRSRQFANSMGMLAKTDTIDAQSLARFAERMEPSSTPPPDKYSKALHELHTARRQVSDEVADLKRQLHTAEHPVAARQIRARIAMGERHKAVLEKEIQGVISAHSELRNKFEILTSIPGIGRITAAILLADLTELGQANAKEIAALVGVAPMNWDSGKKRGNRMIRGGRKCVRNALYMCAVSCIGRSDSLGRTYQNLTQRGKFPKVALTAVMRKLVILANSLITENRKWQEKSPC